jgi:hypothetical protein
VRPHEDHAEGGVAGRGRERGPKRGERGVVHEVGRVPQPGLVRDDHAPGGADEARGGSSSPFDRLRASGRRGELTPGSRRDGRRALRADRRCGYVYNERG